MSGRRGASRGTQRRRAGSRRSVERSGMARLARSGRSKNMGEASAQGGFRPKGQ
jgi:hypothetical protein